jgi:hypothetical protein
MAGLSPTLPRTRLHLVFQIAPPVALVFHGRDRDTAGKSELFADVNLRRPRIGGHRRAQSTFLAAVSFSGIISRRQNRGLFPENSSNQQVSEVDQKRPYDATGRWA